MDKKENDYQAYLQTFRIDPPIFKRFCLAFLCGGGLSVSSQWLIHRYMYWFLLSEEQAITWTIVTLIGITALLTGFGMYDRFGQIFGGGLLVFMPGFANATISASLEHRHEGVFAGSMQEMFKLSGALIVVAILSCYAMQIIQWLFLT